MRKILMALTLAGLAGATQLRADDDKMMLTPEKLVGTYRITSGKEYGGKAPKENVTDTLVKIEKGKITTYDAGENEVYVTKYKLDTAGKMTKIMMTAIKPKEGVEANGLIKMEGETVTLIYALPGGKDPTEFKTGDKQLMFVMKKAGAMGKMKMKDKSKSDK